MRRFVQALSGFEVFPGLPDDVGAALRALPDRYNVSVRQTAAVLFAADDRWHRPAVRQSKRLAPLQPSQQYARFNSRGRRERRRLHLAM